MEFGNKSGSDLDTGYEHLDMDIFQIQQLSGG